MQNSQRANALLKWAAVAVPGLSVGIGWAAASAYPPWVRIVCGIAAAVTLYALLHLLLRGTGRRRG